jgi:hypothetical protein
VRGEGGAKLNRQVHQQRSANLPTPETVAKNR